ncbi:MAG TPA: FAD-binding oxidoreductase [Actinomycetes bacterium]|nr:FAD-binding oxidoreductase [Actinomycetes bacterium]
MPSGEPGRPALLTGWGAATATHARLLPVRTEGDVLRVLTAAPGRGAIPRGLGRSYGDPALNAGGTVLDMTLMDRVLDLDQARGLLTVQAGASIDALARALLPLGWFVPVTPGTRQVTVGGAIATDVHGKNHHRAGSFGAHLTGMRVALPDGTVHAVSPELDRDLHWATIGGMGLTGVVLDATVQLLPVPSAWMSVSTERADDLDALLAALRRADRQTYSVAWVDLMAGGAASGRGVVTSAEHAQAEALPSAAAGRRWALPERARIGVPRWTPAGLLNRASGRAFNEAWFRRAPVRRDGEVVPLGAFFHPLDGVRDWNRLYGARGFVQHQCVVPDEATLREVLRRVRDSRVPSFLAVLKRLGPADPGPLSFPRPGWTLAFDVAASAASLGGLLDDLDEIVAAAGGSVYLAKDSRLRPQLLPALYPRLDRWRAVRERVDPHRVLTSDLARRLSL